MSLYQIPDYVERKGSLFLRGDHMNYSRGVLNSNWDQGRQSEPKDYDISKGPVRNLKWSTYKRIGSVTDGSLPETTYQEYARQVFLKPMYTEQDIRRPMVNFDSLKYTHIDRDTGDPKTGFYAVLPRHYPGYKKQYFNSTYKSDFKEPFPYEHVPEVLPEPEDNSAAYRRCHSQFTDRADYRRPGWNTWQDESGIYGNSHFKREVYLSTDPILRAFKD